LKLPTPNIEPFWNHLLLAVFAHDTLGLPKAGSSNKSKLAHYPKLSSIDIGCHCMVNFSTMNLVTNLSVQQLRQAADLKEKIAALERELSQLLGSTAQTAIAKAPKKKFTMSAAAKLRWAKVKGVKPAAAPKASPAPKKQGGMSAAGRARISAAAKARWAKAKAAGKKSL
jgi:hypothetical protein